MAKWKLTDGKKRNKGKRPGESCSEVSVSLAKGIMGIMVQKEGGRREATYMAKCGPEDVKESPGKM